ncbi:MAG TPA: signal peptide peptidase SppA, partial [Candidatus Syntrophosphaera thermopropionivorans]|nr:signal peptide peptidase SppA [Candidatus Syntrophosphaera thermopropionivorans]
YACGNIVMGKGTPGTKIASQTTVDLIRKARQDPKYKGIILRVDSGGGSAQASDMILRELQLAQTVNKKPVVVSMSGTAASGGYYISCGADRIIAEPSTITGSIGVVGLVFTFPRLYDKIGINWSTVKKGEHADFGATYRDWTDEEKQLMTKTIESTYDRFVDKVDEGRKNLTREQVDAVAQGRVWTGTQAKENGLIDDLGGLDKALEHMQELTKAKGKLVLEDATTSKGGFSMNMNFNLNGITTNNILSETMVNDYKALYEWWKDYQNESVLMLCPLSLKDIEF